MMRQTLLFALILCFCLPVVAQQDSSTLDDGTLHFNKSLTQKIVIKGSDLEKMPVANLTEALKPWLYGVYTDPQHVTYIVDGNVLNDVNSYSIYDVDEVTFIQNAISLTTTDAGLRMAVLIKTRRGGAGKSGFTGAAQAGVVAASNADAHVYHQYYVRGYENFDHVTLGLSGGFQRDILPGAAGSARHTQIPFRLDRWRLNGDLSIRPNAKNTIDVHAGYTPQQIDNSGTGEYSTTTIFGQSHVPQHLFNAWAQWHGAWLPGLHNDLQTGIVSMRGHDNSTEGDYYYNGGTLSSDSNVLYSRSYSDHIRVRDRVGYIIHAGDWSIEPSLNIAFEHYRYGYYENYNFYQNGSNYYGYSHDTAALKNDVWLLTPAVDLRYQSGLDVQGGITADHGWIAPFVSASVDVLHLLDPNSTTGLTFFGSYTRRAIVTYTGYNLTDLNMSNLLLLSTEPSYIQPSNGTADYVGHSPSSVWVWEAGLRYSLLGDRLTFNYHFERFNSFAWDPTLQSLIKWKSALHNLGVNFHAGNEQVLQWMSSLNVIVLTNKTDQQVENPNFPIGDVDAVHLSWAGGWTNRLQYKGWSLGLDLLYRLHQGILNSFAHPVNSLDIRQVYLGYDCHLAKKRNLELYVNSRDLFQNNSSTLAAQNRYYGVGGKMTLL